MDRILDHSLEEEGLLRIMDPLPHLGLDLLEWIMDLHLLEEVDLMEEILELLDLILELLLKHYPGSWLYLEEHNNSWMKIMDLLQWKDHPDIRILDLLLWKDHPDIRILGLLLEAEVHLDKILIWDPLLRCRLNLQCMMNLLILLVMEDHLLCVIIQPANLFNKMVNV